MLRLAIFDIDGTLADSQHQIADHMGRAFAQVGLASPAPGAVRATIGLSLHKAIAQLDPSLSAAVNGEIELAYTTSFGAARLSGQAPTPLYDGVHEMLTQLEADENMLLAAATGKSLRGLRAVLAEHGLERRFVSLQTADGHPSKPHPSMILAALAETGVEAAQAVMIGDTSFDMEMAHAAGVSAIGVAWGYHAAETLRCTALAQRMDDLPALIGQLTENAQ